MNTIEYKGYEVTSASEQLAGSSEWTLRVSIVKYRYTINITNQQFFDAKNSFSTKEEADSKSVEFGRNIIDGKLPNLNTDNL